MAWKFFSKILIYVEDPIFELFEDFFKFNMSQKAKLYAFSYKVVVIMTFCHRPIPKIACLELNWS